VLLACYEGKTSFRINLGKSELDLPKLMEIRLLVDSLVVRGVFVREKSFRLYYAIG
jgi:hypothetical protein